MTFEIRANQIDKMLDKMEYFLNNQNTTLESDIYYYSAVFLNVILKAF